LPIKRRNRYDAATCPRMRNTDAVSRSALARRRTGAHFGCPPAAAGACADAPIGDGGGSRAFASVMMMSDLLQLFPSILLVLMIVITLMLLPLLNDEPSRREETQRTDEIRAQHDNGRAVKR
jgi:hypothetical protein